MWCLPEQGANHRLGPAPKPTATAPLLGPMACRPGGFLALGLRRCEGVRWTRGKPQVQVQVLHSKAQGYNRGWGGSVGEGVEGHGMVHCAPHRLCTKGLEGEEAGRGGRGGPAMTPTGRSQSERPTARWRPLRGGARGGRARGACGQRAYTATHVHHGHVRACASSRACASWGVRGKAR